MNFFKRLINAIMWTFFEKNMLLEQKQKGEKNDSL